MEALLPGETFQPRHTFQANSSRGTIERATSAAQIDEVRALFLEYAASLGLNLCFQNFQSELDGLPGSYAAPRGLLLLARSVPGEPAGCIGVRPFEESLCEMKRLYVRPQFRGTGLGRKLVESALEWAVSAGYRAMVLDTIPGKMDSAIRLYRELGFVERPAYYQSPIEGTLYLEKRL